MVCITVYRIVGTLAVSEHGQETVLVMEVMPEFDSSRHVGDSDFAVNVEFKVHEIGISNTEQHYYRPTNFEAAFNWVLDTDTIFWPDKPRILTLLNHMQDDPTLFIQLSR